MLATSMLVDNPLVSSLASVGAWGAMGAATGMAVGPLGGRAGLVGGMGYGIYSNADALFGSTIAQAQPVVDAATTSKMDYSVNLLADIKIEAGTSDAALSQFKDELQSQVFQPMFMRNLQEAQSTMSVYAR
jgi:hypothetical protein